MFKYYRNVLSGCDSAVCVCARACNSSGVSGIPARNQRKPASGEADKSDDGQQVGWTDREHRGDAELSAGSADARRTLQGTLLSPL